MKIPIDMKLPLFDGYTLPHTLGTADWVPNNPNRPQEEGQI